MLVDDCHKNRSYLLFSIYFPDTDSHEKNLLLLNIALVSLCLTKSSYLVVLVTNKPSFITDWVASCLAIKDLEINVLPFDSKVPFHSKGHKLPDFRWAFTKIDALDVFCKTYSNFEKVIVSDLDVCFFKSKDTTFNPENGPIAIDYGREQDCYSRIGSFLKIMNCTKSQIDFCWMSSGFMVFSEDQSRYILQSIDKYWISFINHGKKIKDVVNHYGDELLFSLAIYDYGKCQPIDSQGIIAYRPAKILWTVFTKIPTMRLFIPWSLPFHLHVPDIKYNISRNNLKKMANIVNKNNYLIVVTKLCLWINYLILRRKIYGNINSFIRRRFFYGNS